MTPEPEFKSGGYILSEDGQRIRTGELIGERIFPLGLLRQIHDMGLLGAALMCGLMDATDEEFSAIIEEWRRKSDPPQQSTPEPSESPQEPL